MEKSIEVKTIKSILQIYGFNGKFIEQKSFCHYIGEDGLIKLIFRVTLGNGQMMVVKILHEKNDLLQDRQKRETELFL